MRGSMTADKDKDIKKILQLEVHCQCTLLTMYSIDNVQNDIRICIQLEV